jgi:cytoskeletal protein CcmA (bactofilin family)
MSRFRSHSIRLALVALLGLVLMGTFGPNQIARAVEFDDDGIIAADEVIDDDVFISSETVVVDGTVNGTLFVSASSATINGTVGGDLLVTSADTTFNGLVKGNLAFAGQFLSLDGTVEGTLFSLGNTVTLGPSAVVGRNLFFTGLSLETEPGSTIGRDVEANGYQALLGGQVDRNVQAGVVALEIGGSIDGDVVTEVSEPGSGFEVMFSESERATPLKPAGLRVEPEAQIGGTLTYTSTVEQASTIEAVPGGGIVYRPPDEKMQIDLEWQARQWVLKRMQMLLTLVVLGCLAAWRFPALLSRAAEYARAEPLPSAGWGLVIVLGGFAGVFVLAGLIVLLGMLLIVVTLGELSFAALGLGFFGLGLAFILFWLIVAYGSKLVVLCLVGQSLLRRIAPRSAETVIWPLLLGIVLYIPLRSIPVLGWLVGIVVTLIGMGALWLLFRQRRSIPAPPLVDEDTPLTTP